MNKVEYFSGNSLVDVVKQIKEYALLENFNPVSISVVNHMIGGYEAVAVLEKVYEKAKCADD